MDERRRPMLDQSLLHQWGTETITAAHQVKYVKHFLDASGKVLEVGSGKGVMLGLLRNAGIAAYGLDLSEEAAEICRKKGLEVVLGDVLSHLESLPAESLGGIFCAHVIEHMPPTSAVAFIAECRRVLRQRGRVVLITPNARDLRTTERFWLDLTHVRPYPEKLLRVLLTKQGFREVRTFCDTEPSANVLEKVAKALLRAWFMGYMFTGDLVVVAER